MNWTPEALKIIRELESNCPDFVNAACEYVATQAKAPGVTSEHVATVLAWMATVTVDIGKEKETP